MRSGFPLLALVLAAAAGENPEPWPAFLDALRQRALGQTAALPDFLCLRTAVETVRPAAGALPIEVGQWTTEVTFQDHQEHYRQLRPGPAQIGVISGGEFGATLGGLFDPRSGATFRLKGFESLRGHKAARVEFEVPPDRSSFTLADGKRVISPAYQGECWAEADSKEVLRLHIEVPKLPKDFPVQRAIQRIEYEQVKIGDRLYWLPVSAHSEVRLVATSSKRRVDLHKMIFGVSDPFVKWYYADVKIKIKFEKYRKFQAETKLIVE